MYFDKATDIVLCSADISAVQAIVEKPIGCIRDLRETRFSNIFMVYLTEKPWNEDAFSNMSLQ